MLDRCSRRKNQFWGMFQNLRRVFITKNSASLQFLSNTLFFHLILPQSVDGELFEKGVIIFFVDGMIGSIWTVNFYFSYWVGEHAFEGLDFLDDVVDALLLIPAEEMFVLLHILGQLPLELLRLLFVEDSRSFLLLVHFFEIDFVLNFGDVEDGGEVVDALHTVVCILL